jgi:hypothetical protein
VSSWSGLGGVWSRSGTGILFPTNVNDNVSIGALDPKGARLNVTGGNISITTGRTGIVFSDGSFLNSTSQFGFQVWNSSGTKLIPATPGNFVGIGNFSPAQLPTVPFHINYTGADSNIVIIDAGLSSANSYSIFSVFVPTSGGQKGLGFFTRGETSSWGLISGAAGGTGKPGFIFGPVTNNNGRDVGIVRDFAKILRVSDGSTGMGGLIADNLSIGANSTGRSKLNVTGGNISITTTNTGIVFPDGTFQTTAPAIAPNSISTATCAAQGANNGGPDSCYVYCPFGYITSCIPEGVGCLYASTTSCRGVAGDPNQGWGNCRIICRT